MKSGECIVGTVQPHAVKQKKDEILYSFDLSLYDDYKVEWDNVQEMF